MPVPTSAVEVAVSMDVSYMLYLSLQILLTAQTCATLPITTTSFPTSTTDTSTGTTHSSTSIDATSTSNTSPITTTPFPTNSGADTTCNSFFFFFSIMANVSESIHPVNATVASSADVDTPGNDAPITNSPSPTMSGDNSMGNTFSTPSPADTHATCTNTLSPMTDYSFFYKSVCC